jgi:hypothetical protein
MGRSTGVAMELRKSRPGESAMKIAGVLSGATAFLGSIDGGYRIHSESAFHLGDDPASIP